MLLMILILILILILNIDYSYGCPLDWRVSLWRLLLLSLMLVGLRRSYCLVMVTAEEGLTQAIWSFLLYQREAATLLPEPLLKAPLELFEDLVRVVLILYRYATHDELERDLLPLAEEPSRTEIV